MKKQLFFIIITMLFVTGIISCSNKEETYKVIKDMDTLHQNIQEIIEQAETQKGFLVINGTDLKDSDSVMVLISTGDKTSKGHGIGIRSLKKIEDRLDIVVEETESTEDNLIMISVEYDFKECRVVDTKGNEFTPVKLQGPEPLLQSEERKEADVIVQKFIDALNSGDEEAVLDCLVSDPKGFYTTETVEAALMDYEVYFMDGKIKGFECISIHPEIPYAFLYRLIGENDITKEVTVFREEDLWGVDDELLHHSYGSKHLLQAFLHAIEQEDERLLANVLESDNSSYPVDQAVTVIEKYKEHFDLDTLEYEFIDVNSEENYFIYSIIGQKSSAPAEHTINIVYDSDFIIIRDEWVPLVEDGQED